MTRPKPPLTTNQWGCLIGLVLWCLFLVAVAITAATIAVQEFAR